MVIDFAICSKDRYVTDPSYKFATATAQETAWTGGPVPVRKEKIGNRYTTYFRATFTDPTTNGTNMCSIRFQTNGVFVYDAYVEYDGTDYVTISPTNANVGKTEGTATFNVTSNVNWTATSDQNWCVVTPTSGNGNGAITATVSDNPKTTQRKAHVKVMSANAPDASAVITQAAGDPRLNASLSFAECNYNSSDIQCPVESNIVWYVDVDRDWVVPFPLDSSNNDQLNIHVKKNFTTASRGATVTIHNSESTLTDTISISQSAYAGPALEVSPLSIECSAAGTSKTVNVLTNKSWTVTKSDSWITLSKTSGSTDGSFTIKVAPYTEIAQRSGTVTVKTAGNADTSVINITQAGAEPIMTITPESLSFTYAESTGRFNINSNLTNWDITNNDEWCHIDPTTGNHNGTIDVSVDANDTYSERTATLTISSTDLIASKAFVITQDASIAPEPDPEPEPEGE